MRSLNDHEVRYLIVGGYAVAYHGYPRSTGNIDIWIAVIGENAERMSQALKDFGFDVSGLSPDLFIKEDQIVRMGYPPLEQRS